IDPIGNPASAKGMYGKGNREWHVIIEDEPLASVFELYIKHDRDGSEAEAKAGAPGMELDMAATAQFPDLFVPIAPLVGTADAAPAAKPVRPAVLPSTPRNVEVLPVLTPDNYIAHIMKLFDEAERSIYLQYAYITYSDKPVDKPFTAMLKKLAELSYRP